MLKWIYDVCPTLTMSSKRIQAFRHTLMRVFQGLEECSSGHSLIRTGCPVATRQVLGSQGGYMDPWVTGSSSKALETREA